MKLIGIGPVIHQFDTFAEFAKEFNIGKGDLVLTHEFIYDPFMKELGLEADFLFQEKYGNGEPNSAMLEGIANDLAGKTYKRLFGIGGGTVIDLAKITALDRKGHTFEEVFFEGAEVGRNMELILAPTTCGTGSEVTNVSVVSFESMRTKKGLYSEFIRADQAVLVPELVRGLPYKFFLFSALDALVHAIESYISPFRSAYSSLFAVEAFERLLGGFKHIAENDENARFDKLADFVLGSTAAGISFDNAHVGPVHGLSNMLGNDYHIPHGETNYEMLMETLKFYNEKNPDGQMKDLREQMARLLGGSADDGLTTLENLLVSILPVKPLHEYGVKEEELPEWADRYMKNSAHLNGWAPAALTYEDALALFQRLY